MHPLCECPACDEGRKVLTIANVVDHIIPHRGNTDLFWDELNWQAMAKPCHDKKTWMETTYAEQETEFRERRMPSDLQPSRIPCIMVCGPPNGGKHPYVREHAGTNDVVIDLDQIMQDVSGQHPWEFDTDKWLPKALLERNRRLHALSADHKHDKAWFTINAPKPRERALWARRLGAQVVMLTPSLPECIRRIHAEPYHQGYTERMIEAAQDWWSRNDLLKQNGVGR
jgi:HNH endonuclease